MSDNKTLIQRVKEDQLTARKHVALGSDMAKITVNLLTTLIGESQIDGKDPSDEELTKVIQKFIKNIDVFLLQSNDESRKVTLNQEKTILKSFLPPELSEEDIRDFLDTAVMNGDKITRAFMGKINMLAKASGKVVDNKLASVILSAYIN